MCNYEGGIACTDTSPTTPANILYHFRRGTHSTSESLIWHSFKEHVPWLATQHNLGSIPFSFFLSLSFLVCHTSPTLAHFNFGMHAFPFLPECQYQTTIVQRGAMKHVTAKSSREHYTPSYSNGAATRPITQECQIIATQHLPNLAAC